MFSKKKIKELEGKIKILTDENEMYLKNAAANNEFKMELCDKRREIFELEWKLSNKEDLKDVIKRVKKIYLNTMDEEFFNQYITLVKLYNRIGE